MINAVTALNFRDLQQTSSFGLFQSCSEPAKRELQNLDQSKIEVLSSNFLSAEMHVDCSNHYSFNYNSYMITTPVIYGSVISTDDFILCMIDSYQPKNN